MESTVATSAVPVASGSEPLSNPANVGTAGVRARAATPPPRKVAVTTPSVTPPAKLAKLDAALLRASFIRKVYGILSAQLAMTVMVATVCTFSQTVRGLILKTQLGGWFNLLVYFPTLACLLGLQFKKDSYPTNYWLLAGFTFCISLNVGVVCSILHSAGLGIVIVQATSITTAIFFGLTAYALHSGRDFSYMKSFLACSLWGMVFGGFLSVFLGIAVVDSALAWFGAIVFCGYILYDTDRLATKLGYDDYIVAACELYLDIINLFMYILKILLRNKKGKK